MLARLALNLTTEWRAADGQTIDREREQPKMIMMRPMAARWAWAAVAGSLKIIDRMLKPTLLGSTTAILNSGSGRPHEDGHFGQLAQYPAAASDRPPIIKKGVQWAPHCHPPGNEHAFGDDFRRSS